MGNEYDYTRDDSAYEPSEAEIDNFMLPSAAAPTATADQIEDENSFEVPPGEHVLVVTGFRGMPEMKTFSVMLDGRVVSYTSATVKVKFGLAHNQKKNVEDFFVLPPANPAELEAYTKGLPTNAKTNTQPGLAASKFYHFMDRLGFRYPPGGTLPEAARKIGNWKGRAIRAVVQAGNDWTDDQGKPHKGYNKIKFWSYKSADQASTLPGDHVPLPGQTSFLPATGAPVGQPAAHPVGLDNV